MIHHVRIRVAITQALLLGFGLGLISCRTQTVEYFKVSIIVAENVAQDATAHSAIRSVSNYYLNSSCPDKVFVPAVTLVRADLLPERSELVADPLSPLNRWRRKVDLLPAANLMEDYDRGLQKVAMGELLTLKSDSAGADIGAMHDKYPSAELLPIDDSLTVHTEAVKKKINEQLCGKQSSFTVLLYHAPRAKNLPPGIATFDSALVERDHEASSWEELYDQAANNVLTESQHAFDHPKGYRFLVRAAQKSLETGKKQEMIDRLERDCPTDLLVPNVCRLKVGHTRYWNGVLVALYKDDKAALKAIDSKLTAGWVAHYEGVDTQVAEFDSTIEIEHANAKSWRELFYKADEYVVAGAQQEYGYPSAYCYLVCAAEKAISTGRTNEMYDAMEEVCVDDNTRNLCGLGKQANWRKLMDGVQRSDSEALEALEEGIRSGWIAHLQGEF